MEGFRRYMRRYGIQHLINSLFVSVLVGVLCSCGDDIEAMRRQAEIGIEASLSKARESLRYGNYPETLATLQKLQGNAYLTELHKKRINRLMDAAVDAIIEQELEKGPDLPPELPNP